MALRRLLARDVFKEAYDRVLKCFRVPKARHIVSFSGGKDSTIVLELCLMAAEATGNLPIDVQFCDEEAMFPGTPEILERTANRKGVRFYWHVLHYPQVNIFNRINPFWWVFDQTLPPEKWMRPLHPTFIPCKENEIADVVNLDHFPIDVKGGERIFNYLGIRTVESVNRTMGMVSAKHYVHGPHSKKIPIYGVWPVYDWGHGDVWKAIADFKWDYNTAYDGFTRIGLPIHQQRVAPPTMMPGSIRLLRPARSLWPKWFDQLCDRLPGVRQGVEFGWTYITPHHRTGETWKECFYRECVAEAPKWIAYRAEYVAEKVMEHHGKHASYSFPDISGCPMCRPETASWNRLAITMYNGDPFGYKQAYAPDVQPQDFRPGAGTWKKGGEVNTGWGRKVT